jgi:site-specific DNA recombinase
MTAKKTVRCAIYTRKSTEEGLEQEFNSLDAQREACEAYIASQKSEGWIGHPGHYDDGGFSGGTLERPALQRLLMEMERGEVDVVVVYKIDRLSRSLMDFAKLVEVFDRKSVTFVSVTQSFNTTTSMGRLTLNVLLSFAQFEREVTGERIRDKFAASKKKGMWMGGCPPLGYEIDSRKLIVNFAEAKTVNLIFRRYLDLGSVRALSADLISKRVVSKVWTSSTGRNHGGEPFDRGALYCLLKNRVYVGETTHKGTAYPGEHEAIVSRQIFDGVQEQLASQRRRQLGKRSAAQDALLAGILFDEEGTSMTPVYTRKPDGKRYRYYASRSRLSGDLPRVTLGRIPAPPLEALILGVLARLQLAAGAAHDTYKALSVLRRVAIRPNSMRIELDGKAAFHWWRSHRPAERLTESDLMTDQRTRLASGEELTQDGEHLIVSLPVRAQFRGGRAAMLSGVNPQTKSSQPDVALIKAIARAHQWRKLITRGEVTSIDALATRVGQERRHVGRTLALAFLAPDLTRAILKGEQPAGLRLAHLLDSKISLFWRDQRTMFGSGTVGVYQ